MLHLGYPRQGVVPLIGAAALTSGLVSATMTQSTLRWELSATVPVMCSILDIDAPAQAASRLAITTTCNAESYRLMLDDGSGSPALRAARSSAGRAQISGSAVIITSNRPGRAVTTIDLAEPVSTSRVAVTLDPS